MNKNTCEYTSVWRDVVGRTEISWCPARNSLMRIVAPFRRCTRAFAGKQAGSCDGEGEGEGELGASATFEEVDAGMLAAGAAGGVDSVPVAGTRLYTQCSSTKR